jgi:hypothetical protein
MSSHFVLYTIGRPSLVTYPAPAAGAGVVNPLAPHGDAAPTPVAAPVDPNAPKGDAALSNAAQPHAPVARQRRQSNPGCATTGVRSQWPVPVSHTARTAR